MGVFSGNKTAIKNLEAEVAALRSVDESKSQRIQELQQRVDHLEARNSELEASNGRVERETRERQQETRERQQEQDMAHAIRISELEHELEAVRQNAGANRPSGTEQWDTLESLERADYEERVRRAQEDRDTIQQQFNRLVGEMEDLRKEVQKKNQELFVKDNRLEWVQQRAAALAKGDSSSPFLND